MTKTFKTCLVLLSLLLLQGVDVLSMQAGRPQTPAAEQQQPVEDPLGRATPHGTVVGLIRTASQDLDRAAEYLDSGLRPAERRELARKLSVVLDRKLLTSLDRLSNEPGGDLGDGLINRDRIGLVESPSGNVELFVDRVQRGPGNSIWLFSSGTLQEIPRLYDELPPLWFERYVPEPLRTTEWLSIPLYRWIALLVLLPLIFVFASLSTRALTVALRPVFRRLTREQGDSKLGSVGPFRLLIVAMFFYGASFFGLSLATRRFWTLVAETLSVMALCWLALRLVDLLTDLSLKRLQRLHRSGDTALVWLINRLSKAAAVIVGGLFLLYLSDIDLTAALTGLGVGGLAIGFGAQKTIENLFGGIMVISDKPINVGDVCRVGEFFGTIEDIGIRSTRIRTLDRSVVSVPNGQLASMSLENLALRDQILFHHTIGLGYQTTADQLRHVLAAIRRLLAAHSKVDSTSARTRFVRFSGSSLDLEIFAYVRETEQPAFLQVQEDLLLGIMDIIDASGATIAVPVFIAPPAKVRALNT